MMIYPYRYYFITVCGKCQEHIFILRYEFTIVQMFWREPLHNLRQPDPKQNCKEKLTVEQISGQLSSRRELSDPLDHAAAPREVDHALVVEYARPRFEGLLFKRELIFFVHGIGSFYNSIVGSRRVILCLCYFSHCFVLSQIVPFIKLRARSVKPRL